MHKHVCAWLSEEELPLKNVLVYLSFVQYRLSKRKPSPLPGPARLVWKQPAVWAASSAISSSAGGLPRA